MVNEKQQQKLAAIKHCRDSFLLQTNPPVINTEGETPIQEREFAMDTAGIPKQGFQGA